MYYNILCLSKRIYFGMVFPNNERECERNKGIKLLKKVLGKIINNPTQIHKYGDLHFEKISKKLSKCKPGLNVLYLAGFKKSQNNTRLLWMNTNNNMTILKHIHDTLITMNTTKPMKENIPSYRTNNNQQPQQDIAQMITKLLLDNTQRDQSSRPSILQSSVWLMF